MKKKTKSPTKIKKKAVIIGLVILAILVAAAGYLMVRHNSKQTAGVVTPYPKGPGSEETGATPAPASGGTPVPSTAKPTATPVAVSQPGHPVAGTLAKPTGQPLNKHQISLSSAAIETNATMTSGCQTIIGAACGLTLTGPSGVVKQVAPIATQNGGNQFDWNAKTIGLTPGIWRVQLHATSGSRSSLGDVDQLTVNP